VHAHPVSRGAAHPALPHKLWQFCNHGHLAPGVVVAGVSLRVGQVGHGLVVLNLRLWVVLVWYCVSQAECAPGRGAAQRLQERRASAREGPPHHRQRASSKHNSTKRYSTFNGSVQVHSSAEPSECLQRLMVLRRHRRALALAGELLCNASSAAPHLIYHTSHSTGQP